MVSHVIAYIYNTSVWQSALIGTPDKDPTDRHVDKPPGSSLHWSVGPPPALVTFAATFVRSPLFSLLWC